MPNRYLVTCFLCMWVFAISAPSVFYLTMEDPALIISFNANEEEPGEGEKQDCMEETLALTEIFRVYLVTPVAEMTLPTKNQVSSLDIVHEVVLPPPEDTRVF